MPYKDPALQREAAKRWADRNPVKVKEKRIKSLYGIDWADFGAMLLAQSGLCALCEQPFGNSPSRGPHIDHNHATGAVRGLLHGSCNRAIGLLQEDPEILRKAIRYLGGESDGHNGSTTSDS